MKPQIKEYNCESGEEIVRDATAEEIAQIDQDTANAVAEKAEIEEKINARKELLKRLGITAEEAQLLLS